MFHSLLKARQNIWDEYYIAEGWSLYPLCRSERREQYTTIEYLMVESQLIAGSFVLTGKEKYEQNKWDVQK